MVNKFSLKMIEKSNLEKVKRKIKIQLDEFYKNKKTLVLFGAGIMGKENLKIIKSLSKCNVVFCDNDLEKRGLYFDGVKVIDIKELKAEYSKNPIMITSITYYYEIREQLLKLNLGNRIIDTFDSTLLMNDDYIYYDSFVKEKEYDFASVYELLADDFSKRLFIERINYIITKDKKYLVPLKSSSKQYFEENLIYLTDEEVFIDGGGYTGDTVEEFLKQSNKFKKIYSFEPEPSKHNIFLNKFRENKNMQLVPYGLWDREDILKFEAADSGFSTIKNTGNMEIKVVSLDDFLNGQEATYIKMDIEGAELKALKGAKNTITKYKPKLALCIYHKPLDIIEIPLYLKTIEPRYKFYLRHYSNFHTETVLYAIAD